MCCPSRAIGTYNLILPLPGVASSPKTVHFLVTLLNKEGQSRPTVRAPLLPTGLSSNEIAAALTISVSTARSRSQSLYGKLPAHNRAEAMARARQLGWL